MNIELGVLELKYNDKSIPWSTDYQTFCNFFDDADKFYHNAVNTAAATTSKVIIIDALHSVRVPLNQSGFVQMLWAESLSEPCSITIVHDNSLRVNKIQYSYQELLSQIKTGKIVLPIKQTAPARLSCRDGITLSASTAFSDLRQLALFYDTSISKISDTWTCCYEIIFDGVRCDVWCKFDDDNELYSITFDPVYAGENDFACEDPVGNAEMCKKRLLEIWGKPDISEGCDENGFYMIYNFDECQVSNGLEYISKDNIPVWYGLEIEFQEEIRRCKNEKSTNQIIRI